jgi:hypothetical protein
VLLLVAERLLRLEDTAAVLGQFDQEVDDVVENVGGDEVL